MKTLRAPELPAGTPSWITVEMVEETLRVWQPKYKQAMTKEDAISILRNVGRLIATLSPEAKQ